MKIRFRTIVLLAVLCIATNGCQKENTSLFKHDIQQLSSMHVVVYYIDGIPYQTIIGDETGYSLFVREMASLAKKGHQVLFRETTVNDSVPASKEIVTYVTNDEDDAITWCLKKTKEGYDVQMEYDPRTGNFTCTAKKPGGRNNHSDTLSNRNYY